MIKLVKIINSPNSLKKYRAVFSDGRHTDFGASGYEDFTTHKDENRKDRYIMRHKKHENWNDAFSAGSLSKWILWSEPTIEKAIEKYKKHFNL